MRKKKKLAAGLTALAALLLLSLFLVVPPTTGRALRSVCRAEAACCYIVSAEGGDTLFVSLPGTAPRAGLNADSVAARTGVSAAFVSAEGHIATSDSLVRHCPDTLPAPVLRAALLRLDTLLARDARRDSLALRELDYYARTHSVTDDGYNEVMAFRERARHKKAADDSTRLRLARLLAAKRLPAARLTGKYRAVFCHAADSGTLACDTLALHPCGRSAEGVLLLQTDSRRLPRKARRLSVFRFGTLLPGRRLIAFNDFGGQTAAPLPQALGKSDAPLPAAEGGVWLNAFGNFCGTQTGGRALPVRSLARLLAKEHCYPVWWWKDVKAFFLSLWDGTPRSAARPLPAPARCVEVAVGDTAVYRGQTDGGGRRCGYGSLTTRCGTRYEGLWRGDTLPRGTRADSAGCYSGDFDGRLRPAGNGVYQTAGGEYYCGEWENGRRHGHGFCVNGGSLVRCGLWRDGRFRGERMVYTTDRVYGIDISRYQHEIGKKKYAIDWRRLRITGLGANKRIKGAADYPVSFVYIKSTQGKSLLNRYYAADLRQARRHGIAVGAYHFFSPFSTGRQQAAWFLKNSFIAKGDLPPVLDVEPSEGQIARMGGEARLFSEMLVWLRAVEAHCGKRPILYLSQQFVNRHFPNAPAALRSHDVWIARYGEFKPYVHLLHWQLTPCGRVRGIKGDVDINVFNGTKEQFREYLRDL